MMEESGDESGKSLEPKFVRIPPHQTVQEGKLVRFDCRATGRPYPDVSFIELNFLFNRYSIINSHNTYSNRYSFAFTIVNFRSPSGDMAPKWTSYLQ